MSWWGKVLGGAFGFMLGGPLGALLGGVLGHNLDRGMAGINHPELEEEMGAGQQERVQTAFFTATFSVMGYIAKADGRVSRDEIAMAEAIMSQMQLSAEMRQAAIDLFNKGKQSDFPIDAVVEQFRNECGRRVNLMRMFMEILLQAAYADGELHPKEAQALKKICDILGFPGFAYRQMEALIRAAAEQRSQQYDRHVSDTSNQLSLDAAYAMLGVEASDDQATVKRAYRRLMSQHHPDKLVSKGMPEEMIKLATEKTQQIRRAYDVVRQFKGW